MKICKKYCLINDLFLVLECYKLTNVSITYYMSYLPLKMGIKLAKPHCDNKFSIITLVYENGHENMCEFRC